MLTLKATGGSAGLRPRVETTAPTCSLWPSCPYALLFPPLCKSYLEFAYYAFGAPRQSQRPGPESGMQGANGTGTLPGRGRPSRNHRTARSGAERQHGRDSAGHGGDGSRAESAAGKARPRGAGPSPPFGSAAAPALSAPAHNGGPAPGFRPRPRPEADGQRRSAGRSRRARGPDAGRRGRGAPHRPGGGRGAGGPTPRACHEAPRERRRGFAACRPGGGRGGRLNSTKLQNHSKHMEITG